MRPQFHTPLLDRPFEGIPAWGEVYFVGIGGIGMSALARFLHGKGVRVSGYDKTPSPLTRELEQEGIPVHYTEDIQLIPARPDRVVYTPAVPATHAALQYYRGAGIPVVKRSDILEEITRGACTISIAGTHGKTTITTLTAYLLRHSGFGGNAFLGGIAVNYNTNTWSDSRNVCVVEADEYDRSFLKLQPSIAVITAMDADHLDIYGTVEAMEEAFIQFSQRILPEGWLIRRFGLKRGSELKAGKVLTYSLQNDSADVYAENIRLDEGGYTFDLHLPGEVLEGLRLNMGGLHNVENAVAALTIARALDIDPDLLREALAAFRGVRRRFEYILRDQRLVFIDDYAHHPEELRALIRGARSLFPGRRCTIVFQPHLYTRTRDLAGAFAEVLDEADRVILLPIYPAREEPLPGVNSEMIAAGLTRGQGRVMEKEVWLDWLKNEFVPGINEEFGELLITAGAGDIDALLETVRLIVDDKPVLN